MVLMIEARVFLGGTCNESRWRNRIMTKLDVPYFNPVVDDWTLQHQAEEIRQREICSVLMYTFTPAMTGSYAVAEVVDDSNKRPNRTVMVMLREDFVPSVGDLRFDESRWKSLGAIARLVASNGAQVFTDLDAAADWSNSHSERLACSS